MKTRLFTIVLAALVAGSAFASDQAVRRTVIIKDGKVITDTMNGDPMLEELGGKRAWLGVGMLNISPELSEHFGATKEAGVLVESVADGSPAEKAGVKVGDVIVTLDGKDVNSSGDVRAALRGKKEGDAVRIEVQRGRTRQTVVASVIEKEAQRVFVTQNLQDMTKQLGPEWRAHVQTMGGDCSELQGRIKDLEARLKDLEKRLK
jgi:PDZ domain-containing secreted protein